MRFISFLFISTLCLLLVSCGDKGETQTKTTAPKAEAAAQPTKTKIRKAAVTINPSAEAEYPQVVRDLGFPMHPKGEVANVGNALIEGEGLFMRLNINDSLNGLGDFFDKGMVQHAWEKVDMKIFQGADKALRYEKDDVVCRIIMIDETDYIKVAVNMTKKVNPADYEDR